LSQLDGEFKSLPTLVLSVIMNSMITKLSPIELEFATVEEDVAYDVWFRAKVQASMDDSRPSIPHDQVMAEMVTIIAEAEQRLGRKQA
jgi:hypothetical protein